MKRTIRLLSLLLIILQMFSLFGDFNIVKADIKQGDVLTLKGDHECDSLVQYHMDSGWWSYKIVWYVYYIDEQTGNKYPAFCVEPAKEGVGTGYIEYDTLISKETDNVIWRILSKGYMGSNWKEWNLENDDDFYSANKIAIHSYKDGIPPKTKYRLGDRSVDGNTVEEIQRRGAKVLDVAQALYNYGINGKDIYQSPKISINPIGEKEIQQINGEDYLIQNYKVNSNRYLKSYNISINNFTSETKILDSNNKEIINLKNISNSYFKIAIPTKDIKDKLIGNILIDNAQVKTCPIYYAKSSVDGAQSYVTYSAGFETTNTKTNLEVDPNTASLKIIKIDKESKEPIPNVSFEIYDENNKTLGIFETNENGIITMNNLKPGIIRIKEIKNDNRYILNNDIQEIELFYGKTSEIQIENERKKEEKKEEKSVEKIKTELPKLPRTGY